MAGCLSIALLAWGCDHISIVLGPQRQPAPRPLHGVAVKCCEDPFEPTTCPRPDPATTGEHLRSCEYRYQDFLDRIHDAVRHDVEALARVHGIEHRRIIVEIDASGVITRVWDADLVDDLFSMDVEEHILDCEAFPNVPYGFMTRHIDRAWVVLEIDLDRTYAA